MIIDSSLVNTESSSALIDHVYILLVLGYTDTDKRFYMRLYTSGCGVLQTCLSSMWSTLFLDN